MQFVSYGSDSSDNESDAPFQIGQPQKVNEPSPHEPTTNAVSSPVEVEALDQSSRPEWLNDTESTSDEESGEDDGDRQADVPTVQQKKFDNVASLLSAAMDKPKFLKRSIDEGKFIVAETRQHNYDVADQEYKDLRRSGSNTSTIPNRPAVPRSALSIPRAVGDSSIVHSAKANSTVSQAQSSKKLGEKETAKDRVKRQRLSGQSGIGSDFREWRSEEEMRQRQMYD